MVEIKDEFENTSIFLLLILERLIDNLKLSILEQCGIISQKRLKLHVCVIL